MTGRRLYRRTLKNERLSSFTITLKETDLWIAVSSSSYSSDLPDRIERYLFTLRQTLEVYLGQHPLVRKSFDPCLLDSDAPPIMVKMAQAANLADVGPMAAVAGAIAEDVGLFLSQSVPEVIVENGGDIFLQVQESYLVGIYAGRSPLSGRLALKISSDQSPLGICTSSGTIGPSFSFGCADAAVAVSSSTALADAAATALGNLVTKDVGFENALTYARTIEGLSGVILICGKEIALWGNIEVTKINP